MISKNYSLFFQAIILIVCLALSYLSFTLVHRLAQFRSAESFTVLTDQGLTSIDRRFDDFRRTLDGVAGLIIASDQVTAEAMARYGEALRIADETSGIDAIGFAESGSFDNLRSENLSEPNGSHFNKNSPHQPAADEYFIVRFIEPLASNSSLIGFDFASNPHLFDVAKTSRDTHATILAMNLRTSTAETWQPRAVLLKPIYRTEQTAEISDSQQLRFVGFAFVTINLDNAFKGLTAGDQLVTLVVEDTGANHTAISHTQGIGSFATPPRPKYILSQKFQKFGNTLKLTWRSTPRFDSIQPFRARWIVLALGLLVTGLVSYILHVSIKRNEAVEKIVKQKSRDLDTREKEQRSILENAMLAILSVTPSGVILHSNQTADILLSPQECSVQLTGMSLSNLLPGLYLGMADGRVKLTVNLNPENAETSILEVEKKTWKTSEGEIRLTLILRDITVSEYHIQEIAKTEQRWNLALMGARIGVFDIDLKRQTSVVSQMWSEIIRIDIPPDCAHPYRLQMDRIHPDDISHLIESEAECIAGNINRFESQFRIKLSKGGWRWIQSDAVVVERAADGTALRMLGTQMDITEKIELNQIKRDFVATVSHELRTPLTSIKGALGLLKVQLKDAESGTADRLIHIATANSDKLVSLVNDILDMEKINAGSISNNCKAESLSSIMRLASEQVEPYALQWCVGLEVMVPEGNQYIWTDEKRAIQVLTNLLSNACKFAYPDTSVRLIAEVQSDYVKILVRNYGTGIPDEFRSQVFQPFAQADSSDTRLRGGTGLGLSISSQLVEAMGGTIGFTSIPGEETIFWFTCPLACGPDHMPKLSFEDINLHS